MNKAAGRAKAAVMLLDYLTRFTLDRCLLKALQESVGKA